MTKFFSFSAAAFLLLSCSQSLQAQKSKNQSKVPVAISSAKSASSDAAPRTPVKAACSRASGLTEQEVEAILSTHNKARSETKSPLLTWNCGLAELAQEWADKGVAQHREFSDYGENIFVAGDPKVLATDAVEKWLNERPQWNNSAGVCAAGKTCTHYTQVVWKRTTQIGCGINRNAAGKWKVMIVCNYDPAGNNQPGAAF